MLTHIGYKVGDEKIKKKRKEKNIYLIKKKGKIYLCIFLELLQSVWVQFSFR